MRIADTPVQLVSSLIDADSGQWNEVLIREVFMPPDVYAFFAMPRPHNNADGVWSWAWEHSGYFTVCSAYRALI